MLARICRRWLLLTFYFFLLFLPTLFGTLHAKETTNQIKFGVINKRQNHPDVVFQQYGKFYAYLTRRLAEQDIDTAPLIITQNVQEMENAVRTNTVNMFMEGLMPSLALKYNTKLVKPSLLAWRKGQRQYYSVFFVRRDSSIATLVDLRSHSIAFEKPGSTSAFQVPLAILRQQNITTSPARFINNDSSVHYQFAGTELNQVYWVLRRKTDAAAFNDGDWNRLPEHIRKDLQIIYQSKPMVRWLVSFHQDLKPSTKAAVVKILLHMHEDPQGIAAMQSKFRISRFENLNKKDQANLDYWQKVLINSEVLQ
jgi:ABC-type phosphate/phosphonate transport system substrate-binding protein